MKQELIKIKNDDEDLCINSTSIGEPKFQAQPRLQLNVDYISEWQTDEPDRAMPRNPKVEKLKKSKSKLDRILLEYDRKELELSQEFLRQEQERTLKNIENLEDAKLIEISPDQLNSKTLDQDFIDYSANLS